MLIQQTRTRAWIEYLANMPANDIDLLRVRSLTRALLMDRIDFSKMLTALQSNVLPNAVWKQWSAEIDRDWAEYAGDYG